MLLLLLLLEIFHERERERERVGLVGCEVLAELLCWENKAQSEGMRAGDCGISTLCMKSVCVNPIALSHVEKFSRGFVH